MKEKTFKIHIDDEDGERIIYAEGLCGFSAYVSLPLSEKPSAGAIVTFQGEASEDERLFELSRKELVSEVRRELEVIRPGLVVNRNKSAIQRRKARRCDYCSGCTSENPCAGAAELGRSFEYVRGTR